MSEVTRKKVGRPTKPPMAGAKMALGLRVTPQIKQALDDAASYSGRTQSQEAEYRLEQTFDHRPLSTAVELAYGRELGGLLLLIGKAMTLTRDLPKIFDVHGDEPWTYDQMVKAAESIFETFRPTEDIVQPVLPRYSSAGSPKHLRDKHDATARMLNSEGLAMLNAGVLFAAELLSEVTFGAKGDLSVTRDLIGERLIARARNRSETQVAMATPPAAPNEPVSETTVHARRRSRKLPTSKS